MTPIILGTRGSALAQAQTRQVRDALKRAWPSRTFEIYIIKTRGDQLSEGHAPQNLDKGLFTGELEQALEQKKIHLAVHSLKDLPTEMTAGLRIAAMPPRGDARDVLVTRGATRLADVPFHGKIATGSPRRAAQLTLARPDLEVVDIRGNIDTRLRKLRDTEEWSGLILAAAGLDRLHPNTMGLELIHLPMEVMLPAPGQGALGLQTRDDDETVVGLLQAIHDPMTATCVTAERMFLQALGGGCLEPVGAYARPLPNGILHLEGVAWLKGETLPRRGALQLPATEAARLGVELAVEISR